jgi:hypothetical protein
LRPLERAHGPRDPRRVPRVPLDPEVRRARGRLGAAIRHHPDQPELADAARQQLHGAVAEQYVKELVDGWPPLTPEQRGRLAALLAGSGEGGDDGAP